MSGRGRQKVAVLLLLAPLAIGGCRSAEQVVEVEMRFSRFVPDRMEFPAGATVRFVVHNNDPIDHEFLIGDVEVQRAHETGTEPHHGAKPGEISVPAGETRETTYTFPEPGMLLIGCHLPTHWDYGMRGTIEVT